MARSEGVLEEGLGDEPGLASASKGWKDSHGLHGSSGLLAGVREFGT